MNTFKILLSLVSTFHLIKDAVVIPGKGTKSSAFLRVIPESKIYEIMKQVHKLQHSGYKKCRDYVSYNFYNSDCTFTNN